MIEIEYNLHMKQRGTHMNSLILSEKQRSDLIEIFSEISQLLDSPSTVTYYLGFREESADDFYKLLKDTQHFIVSGDRNVR